MVAHLASGDLQEYGRQGGVRGKTPGNDSSSHKKPCVPSSIVLPLHGLSSRKRWNQTKPLLAKRAFSYLLQLVAWCTVFCLPTCIAFVPHGQTSTRLRGGGRSATTPSAFKFRVITISQTKERWCEEACSEYASRIKKFGVDLEETTLKPAIGPPKQTEEQQKAEEGKNLLSRVEIGSDRLVLLDERGELLTSHEFADYIQRCADSGDRSVTFAIGGASGHSEQVRATASKAGRILSLGKMVLNHQIARVVLLEQIYRALTIQRGIPYHK